jgi:hypothetical protein
MTRLGGGILAAPAEAIRDLLHAFSLHKMQIFRIMFCIHLSQPCCRLTAMLRTPVWATASLLAVAISLAGCGEDKAPAEQAAAPQAATTQSEPAPAAQETVNSEAAQAVVKHYADIAHAVFSDAHSAALKLQEAVDALLANPTEETLQAAKAAWIAARVPYMQSEVVSSTPGRWTKA